MANRVLRNSSNFHVPFPRNNTFHKVSNDINSSFSCWESESNSLHLHVSRNRIRIINCSERTAQKDALDCEGLLMIVRAREITADLPWTEWPPRGSISAMPQRHRQRRRRRRLSPPSPRPLRIWRSWWARSEVISDWIPSATRALRSRFSSAPSALPSSSPS